MDKYKLYAQAWRKYGKDKQIVVAMEECAELTKELSKHLRGKENLINISEEIADVEIMLDQLKFHLGISEMVTTFTETKLIRLQDRVNEV